MKIEKVDHPTPESLIENYGEPFELPPIVEPIKTKEIKSPSSPQKPPVTTPTTTKTSNRWKHDDISKEKIMDILETEKAKIMDKVKNLDFDKDLINQF